MSEERKSDVKFETVGKSKEHKFGKNNFLEIAKKKAITKDGQNEFISVSRGFYAPDGEKRFRKSIAIPLETVKFVKESLDSL